MRGRRGIAIVVALALVAFVGLQAVVAAKGHTNPPVTGEPKWDSQVTRDLAVRACFDCHSNETKWPWYSNLPPVSWLVQRHVDEGRHKLNFSTWGTGRAETEHIISSIACGQMPTGDYQLMHPEARLSDAEKQQLIAGMAATFGFGVPEGVNCSREGGGDGDD